VYRIQEYIHIHSNQSCCEKYIYIFLIADTELISIIFKIMKRTSGKSAVAGPTSKPDTKQSKPVQVQRSSSLRPPQSQPRNTGSKKGSSSAFGSALDAARSSKALMSQKRIRQQAGPEAGNKSMGTGANGKKPLHNINLQDADEAGIKSMGTGANDKKPLHNINLQDADQQTDEDTAGKLIAGRYEYTDDGVWTPGSKVVEGYDTVNRTAASIKFTSLKLSSVERTVYLALKNSSYASKLLCKIGCSLLLELLIR
jgi:hypothetical protein